jgi:ferredoxin
MVLKGSDNLAPKNDKEVDMDLDKGQRLACQCVIVSGEVHIAAG